ncbi:MAG: hypothetical protein JRN52_16300, partial [Nitrososphaerota archaeon]|nr:hypothetical protein [Nitrososphaerota archaeon]
MIQNHEDFLDRTERICYRTFRLRISFGLSYLREEKPPRYYKYHSEVDYIDEIKKIWEKKWGAQGIGRLREVAVVTPTEEVDPLFQKDPTFFNFDGNAPSLSKMQEQHEGMVEIYKENGVS